MRVLFWILVATSLIGALLAVGLLVERASGEAGMAFILFLPACAASAIFGGGAILLRTMKAQALTGFERRIGTALGVLLAVGICALGVALALD